MSVHSARKFLFILYIEAKKSFRAVFTDPKRFCKAVNFSNKSACSDTYQRIAHQFSVRTEHFKSNAVAPNIFRVFALERQITNPNQFAAFVFSLCEGEVNSVGAVGGGLKRQNAAQKVENRFVIRRRADVLTILPVR